MGIDRELLEILACPKCGGEVRLNDEEEGIVCDRCRILYEIRDGLPIMLVDEAKPLDPS